MLFPVSFSIMQTGFLVGYPKVELEVTCISYLSDHGSPPTMICCFNQIVSATDVLLEIPIFEELTFINVNCSHGGLAYIAPNRVLFYFVYSFSEKTGKYSIKYGFNII